MKFEEPRRDNAIIKKTRAEGLRQLVHRTNYILQNVPFLINQISKTF
jgi:hypothetical protein